MGACVSKTLEVVLGPDSNAIAWQAVRTGDEKALSSSFAGKGRSRVLLNARNPQEGGLTLLAAAAEKGHRKVVALLLEKGADPNIATDSGFTPLTLALKGGFDGVATIILGKSPNVEKADTASGKTALLWAVEAGCAAATIQLLAEKGADLDAKSRGGLTALMMATDQNNPDRVRVLLKAGANPKTQDLKAGTALSRAREKHHTLVVQLLEQAILSKGGVVEKEGGGGAGGAGGGGGGAGSPAGGGPGSRKSGNPLAKGALGSQVADLYASGRASGLEKETREKTKDIKYAAVSLDGALNSGPGGIKRG
jgi:hypothetical protein